MMEADNTAVRPFMADHLVELIGDTELYGWAHVHAFYVVWLQQPEQGWVMWADEDAKLKFRRAFV